MKLCEFAATGSNARPLTMQDFRKPWSAEREVFTKTLALFTALRQHGCAFDVDKHATITLRRRGLEDAGDSDSDSSGEEIQRSGKEVCDGGLIILVRSNNQIVIQ